MHRTRGAGCAEAAPPTGLVAGQAAARATAPAGAAPPSRRGRRPGRRSDIGEVLFEFWPAGRYIKVSAMHSATLTEISIVGDASRSQAELEETALQKLRYVLGRAQR